MKGSIPRKTRQRQSRGEIFTAKHRAWWERLTLSVTETLRVGQDLAILDALEAQIEEVEAELHRLSTVPPWAQWVSYRLQLPGFGMIVAITVLAAFGDIGRFRHPKQLVGYAGLRASVKDSGEGRRRGRISKAGRCELGFILLEAARIAGVYRPSWKQQYARLARLCPRP